MTRRLRTLFRPVGLRELELIRDSGMRRFPPRLPGQPIFYPVLGHDYAMQIARDWNTRNLNGEATEVGFVTEFDLFADYLERFAEQVVGSSCHREIWVPAGELDAFNDQIQGRIRVTDVYYGEFYRGPRFNLDEWSTASECGT